MSVHGSTRAWRRIEEAAAAGEKGGEAGMTSFRSFMSSLLSSLRYGISDKKLVVVIF